MMNADRRATQKLNRMGGGGHSHHDHMQLGTRTFTDARGRQFERRDPCTVCRPQPLTITQRAAMSAQREAAELAARRRPVLMGGMDFRDMIGRALSMTRLAAGEGKGSTVGRRTSFTTRGYRKVAK